MFWCGRPRFWLWKNNWESWFRNLCEVSVCLSVCLQNKLPVCCLSACLSVCLCGCLSWKTTEWISDCWLDYWIVCLSAISIGLLPKSTRDSQFLFFFHNQNTFFHILIRNIILIAIQKLRIALNTTVQPGQTDNQTNRQTPRFSISFSFSQPKHVFSHSAILNFFFFFTAKTRFFTFWFAILS